LSYGLLMHQRNAFNLLLSASDGLTLKKISKQYGLTILI